VVKEYKYHSSDILSLFYLSKQNFLLTGSQDATINVLSLSEGKSIQTLTDHNEWVSSLISLNDETFASGSRREIKIWSIKADTSIESIKTIVAHEEIGYSIFLYLLRNDFMLSRSENEFTIWDVETYECLITYKEDSFIRRLIVTGDDNITTTEKKKVNIWKILV
jgi:WD40 repeat protein